MLPRPVVLLILDGVGWGRRDETDALHLARTPHLDALLSREPWCLLKAHGTAVGMPSDADMGNSEVGHNAMGAGRVFDQGARLVNEAIQSGRIWASEAWQDVIRGDTLHLLGLVSDGNVHSHVQHLLALVDRAVADGVRRLRVHVLTDGRDVSARSALTWVEPLEAKLRELPIDAGVGSGGGRMHITMDRYEAEWDMVDRGWRCHVGGEGRRFGSATEAIQTFYAEDPAVDDQWLPAFVVGDYDGMRDGDAVVLFNFRGDRAIEITRAFEEGEEFSAFERAPRPNVIYAGMMEYDGDLKRPRRHLVSPPAIDDTVGERMSAAGLRVLALSETQKFGHVTYFFNGNRSQRLPGETWVEVPSPLGPFDRAPAMAAPEVARRAVEAIASRDYDHVRINLANGDMVGHTGDMGATITALEVVDEAVGAIAAATRAAGGVLLVTADHGNAELKVELDKKGRVVLGADGRPKPKTSHTLNPVPFALVDPSGRWRLTVPTRDLARWAEPSAETPSAGIARIGATLLALCGLPVPESYLPPLVERTG